MTKKELLKIVKDAHKYQTIRAAGLSGSDNPQTKKMRLCAVHKADAYKNVLEALSGNSIMLRLDGNYQLPNNSFLKS